MERTVELPAATSAAPPTDQLGTSLLRARGREKRPDQWKRVVRKNRRIAGQEYVNTKGQVVKSKQIGAACTCRMKCYNRVDENTRRSIFSGFYDLKSYDEQNAYLFGLIRKTEIAHHSAASSERRTCNYQYFVRCKGREIQVCKQAFANIHAITFKKIRMLSQKLDQNIMFPRDQRGKHMNRRKISEEVKDQVRRHISEVLQSTELRTFLKEDKVFGLDLNLSKMHKDYLKRFEPMAFESSPGSPDKLRQGYQTEVKIWLYSTIYHNEFRFANLGALRVSQQKGGRREAAAGSSGSAAAAGSPFSRSAASVARRAAARTLKRERLSAPAPAVSAPPLPPVSAAQTDVLPGPGPAVSPAVSAAPVVVHHLQLAEQPAPPDLMNLAVEQLVFQTAPRAGGPADAGGAPLQLCLPISCVQPLNLQAQPLDLHHPHTVFSVQTGTTDSASGGGGAQSHFESAPHDGAAGGAALTVQDYGGAEVHLVTSAASGVTGAALYDWQLTTE
ncbi:uncharacterized protein LOC122392901 [Amphibalanus amphitrite]|nr:uncharacterized protein LOC122392901 [Amphibalanus amphitrite]XP_043244190.1 uncharacterized protein LOC122392901 [Amphibalanus amphitrite]XP_043244191.1 uncharacterized protein LOC122392901 [Amphibalanus amphitrite]XP_043244193.1 uncharacterized protein LOC122392901 [Amphibalanus amphitrite]